MKTHNKEREDKHNFSKQEAEIFGKFRIIKRNLVHLQGLPYYLIDDKILKKYEYLGQYGTINKIIITPKNDSITGKKSFSVYITFNNEIEASYSILALDSLLIDGKIIRAFFGTTKYCKHFLDNLKCKNDDKCLFLHNLANKEDILGIDSKFGYSEHILLAKKIINYNSNKTKNNILNLKINYKTKFPSIKDIYLREKERDSFPIIDEENNNFLSNNGYNEYNISEKGINYFKDIISDKNFNIFNSLKGNVSNKDICLNNISNNINNCFNEKNFFSFNNNINNFSNNNSFCNLNNYNKNLNFNTRNDKEKKKEIEIYTNLTSENIKNVPINKNFVSSDEIINPLEPKTDNLFLNIINNNLNENKEFISPNLLHYIFKNFIDNIMIRKSLFFKYNVYLKQLEFEFLKNYLNNLGINLNFLEGCLDCMVLSTKELSEIKKG